MPPVTSAEARSGASGLTVVPARPNAIFPATLQAMPASPSRAARPWRIASGTAAAGHSRAMAHIPPATSRTCSSGGTFSSSQRMAEGSGGGFGRPLRLLAVVRIEQLLAQADALRRHLDQLVVADIGDRLFQRHLARRGEADRLVLAGGADVGQLLGLHRVDVEVVVAAVLADDHALIDRRAGIDEQDAAFLDHV